MIQVRQLMTQDVVSLRAGDSAGRAQRLMQGLHFRHIPVVDERNRVVGIVSQRDLGPVLALPGGEERLLREVMATHVMSVHPDTPAWAAAKWMLERKVGSLPVVDEDEALVGIITESDFLAVALRALQEKPGVHLVEV